MKDASKKKRSTWIYVRTEKADRLADVLAGHLQDEPDYNSILANLVGCTMCAYENGSNSIDDNGDDVGDELERFQDYFLNYDC